MSVIAMNYENNRLICDEMSQKIIEAAQRIVTSEGADQLSVRRILGTLGITNRVFYNRFRNIGQVLDAVYRKTVLKIRESITTEIDPARDYFEQVTDIVERALTMSYEVKRQFNHYIFENDSLSESNYEWWNEKIKGLILYAKERDLIAEVDESILAYSIWCFCRGYNADAVGRGLPKEEAIRMFRYSFSLLLNGLKPNCAS